VAEGGAPGEMIQGRFVSSGLRPLFVERAREYGLESEVDALMQMS
jgi:hypothetical protein